MAAGADAAAGEGGSIEFDGERIPLVVHRGAASEQAKVEVIGDAPQLQLRASVAADREDAEIRAALETHLAGEEGGGWLRHQLRLPPGFRWAMPVDLPKAAEPESAVEWTPAPSGAIEFDGERIPYTVRRHSRRKRLEVSLIEGELLVKSPQHLTDQLLHSGLVGLMAANADWLRAQLREARAPSPARTPSPSGEIEFEGATVRYLTRRHPNRRRTAVGVENGALIVKAGPRISDAAIRKDLAEILRERANWFRERLARPPIVPLSREVRDGGRMLYLGERLPVRIDAGARRPVSLDEHGLCLRSPRPLMMQRWLRARAKEQITSRVRRWRPEAGVRPSAVEVVDVTSYWGQANVETREIKFNWRLIFAPPELIDDVVVHELCHLRIAGHQRDFWQLVEGIRSGARKRRAELRRLAPEMVWDPLGEWLRGVR